MITNYTFTYIRTCMNFDECAFLQLSSVADDDSGSFVQVMETFQNIGPILDMSVVDLDKQGQDLVRLIFFLLSLSPFPLLSLFLSLPLSLSPLSLSLSLSPSLLHLSRLSLVQDVVRMVLFELFAVA